MRGLPGPVKEAIKADKDVLKIARLVKTAFFSGLGFFLVFLIFAGFGLAIAYVLHLIVNIGSEPPERFTIPSWVKPVEGWSVGVVILAFIALSVAQPWKDAYRYFRYGSVEPEEAEPIRPTEGTSLPEAPPTEEVPPTEEPNATPGGKTPPPGGQRPRKNHPRKRR